jgi:hypothetical protein
MRARHKGKLLVVHNNYIIYTMNDIPPLSDYKVVLPKGRFNGICAHYNIPMNPDLGIN